MCSHTFSGVIWHCATEINSIQLHESFVMVTLESISLHLHLHLPRPLRSQSATAGEHSEQYCCYTNSSIYFSFVCSKGLPICLFPMYSAGPMMICCDCGPSNQSDNNSIIFCLAILNLWLYYARKLSPALCYIISSGCEK